MRARLGELVLLLLLSACDYYERPNRVIPRDFKAHTLAGDRVDWETFTGKPWVVVLWVPGAPIYPHQVAELESVRRELEGNQVSFLALSLEHDDGAVATSARRLGLAMPVAVAEGEALGHFGLSRLPSTVLVSKDGVIVAATNGLPRRAALVKRVNDLLRR